MAQLYKHNFTFKRGPSDDPRIGWLYIPGNIDDADLETIIGQLEGFTALGADGADLLNKASCVSVTKMLIDTKASEDRVEGENPNDRNFLGYKGYLGAEVVINGNTTTLKQPFIIEGFDLEGEIPEGYEAETIEEAFLEFIAKWMKIVRYNGAIYQEHAVDFIEVTDTYLVH